MVGGVWEWTADDYDALAYRADHPPVPAGAAIEKVIRGGSWADCHEAATVSYRGSAPPDRGYTPNIGVRLVRSLA